MTISARPSEKGLDADNWNAERFQAAMGCGNRTIQVNAATGLFDHDGFETCLARVLRRVADAEIECQSGEEQRLPSAFAQIAGQSGCGLVVVLVKRRIGI